MFLKTKTIHTYKNGQCNARHCTHQTKRINKGEKVVWTVATYRGRTLSRIWHPDCHAKATAYAPYHDRLLAIREGREVLAAPLSAYCPETGRML
mgnify:CR=1